ncbi:MAG: NADPH-dependent FMN reductase [Baekduia sp.]
MSAKILTLVGSLRAASTNRKLAELATELAPEGVQLDIYDGLDQIPFYNEDIDGDGAPEAATRLRDAVAAADAILFVTPVYNGGVPAHLKNAIDWTSRPQGDDASIAGKPVAAIGTAWGPSGGGFAHEAIRTSVGIAGGVPLADVVVTLPDSLGRFTETHPREDAEVVEAVRAAVAAVATAATPAAV